MKKVDLCWVGMLNAAAMWGNFTYKFDYMVLSRGKKGEYIRYKIREGGLGKLDVFIVIFVAKNVVVFRRFVGFIWWPESISIINNSHA